MSPKKKKADRKAYMLRVRITKAQQGFFENVAKKMGTDVSNYARQAMIEKAIRDGFPPEKV